jgi:hypothetical protein
MLPLLLANTLARVHSVTVTLVKTDHKTGVEIEWVWRVFQVLKPFGLSSRGAFRPWSAGL